MLNTTKVMLPKAQLLLFYIQSSLIPDLQLFDGLSSFADD